MSGWSESLVWFGQLVVNTVLSPSHNHNTAAAQSVLAQPLGIITAEQTALLNTC